MINYSKRSVFSCNKNNVIYIEVLDKREIRIYSYTCRPITSFELITIVYKRAHWLYSRNISVWLVQNLLDICIIHIKRNLTNAWPAKLLKTKRIISKWNLFTILIRTKTRALVIFITSIKSSAFLAQILIIEIQLVP